ncbi:AAA family ATPase [bacterium]|nr:AAA family ATPase [bacterium]
MESILELSQARMMNAPRKFRRYLLENIPRDQRLVFISGARGTGKTTLLLQFLRSLGMPSSKAAYISLDDIIFSRLPAEDFAEWFISRGGEYLLIDEVHKLPQWSVLIKTVYDRHPEIKIIISGSSALQMKKGEADLSRRMVTLHLNELSVREFSSMKHDTDIKPFTLDEILRDHERLAADVKSVIKPLMIFDEYLNHGAYPFFKEGEKYFHERLASAVNEVLETDLPAVSGVTYGSVLKIKRMLAVMAESVPFIPNITELGARVGISRDLMYRYLHLLEKAGLIYQLRKESAGISIMSKPEKIYLHNTGLSRALTLHETDRGSDRETFFINQVSASHKVNWSDKGDFIVDGKYTVEIGGKNKSGKQIRDVRNSFIVKDDIEHGTGNVIPLWLFGFLY